MDKTLLKQELTEIRYMAKAITSRLNNLEQSLGLEISESENKNDNEFTTEEIKISDINRIINKINKGHKFEIES